MRRHVHVYQILVSVQELFFFFGSILWKQMVALRQFIYETDGKDVTFFLLKQNLKQNFSKKLRYKSSALIAFCLCTQM